MGALENSEVKEGVDQETVDAVRSLSGKYKYGWETEIEMDYAPKGLSEDIVRLISEKPRPSSTQAARPRGISPPCGVRMRIASRSQRLRRLSSG